MASDQLSMFAQPAGGSEQKKPTSINISKTVNADPQKVYDQWLIPVFVGDWMFGPKVASEQIVNLENTVRKGGEFSYTVKRGGKEIEYSGEYLELDIPRRLVFSWKSSDHPDCESQICAQFDAASDRTRLKLSIKLAAELQEQRDSLKQEWTSRCSALAAKFKK